MDQSTSIVIISLILVSCSLGTTATSIHAFLFPKSIKTTKLYSTPKTYAIQKSEDEWRQTLTPNQFDVLRNSGTEPPNTSYLNTIKKNTPGTFQCAGCGSPLFTTSTKFDSGTGWPSFYGPIDANAIDLSTDFKTIFPRTECSCGACGGHLGHVFDDGPDPTGQRFCMNGVAMMFREDGEDLELAERVEERGKTDPYVVGVGQAFPGAVTNLVVAGLFINPVWVRYGVEGSLGSPLDLAPLVPAIYFGALAINGFRRMLPVSSPSS